MLMSVVAFQGAMYLESGLTSATVLFTNLAFEEQVSFVFFGVCVAKCPFVWCSKSFQNEQRYTKQPLSLKRGLSLISYALSASCW